MISIELKVKGGGALAEKLKRHPELIQRSMESVLKQEARALAVGYGAVTYPVGMGESGAEKLEKRIAGDVKRLFPTEESAWKVYGLLKARDPRLGALYWHAFKSGNELLMGKVLRRGKLPKGVDTAAHQGARVKGKVPGGAKAVALVTAGRQGAYARKVAKRRGIAKAGWFVAAKSLGGRVRTGKGKQRFPKYVRVHGRRTGIGGSRFKGGARASVRIWNTVTYIHSATNKRLMDAARNGAQRSFTQAMEKAVHFANKRKFKRVS